MLHGDAVFRARFRPLRHVRRLWLLLCCCCCCCSFLFLIHPPGGPHLHLSGQDWECFGQTGERRECSVWAVRRDRAGRGHIRICALRGSVATKRASISRYRRQDIAAKLTGIRRQEIAGIDIRLSPSGYCGQTGIRLLTSISRRGHHDLHGQTGASSLYAPSGGGIDAENGGYRERVGRSGIALPCKDVEGGGGESLDQSDGGWRVFLYRYGVKHLSVCLVNGQAPRDYHSVVGGHVSSFSLILCRCELLAYDS